MQHIYTTTFQQALGVRVIEDEAAHEVIEDWSGVRSPSRAARRRRQGHRQNIRIEHKPICISIDGGRTLVMHPRLADQLRKELGARITASIDRQIKNALHGPFFAIDQAGC
jgi:hypothetical protein